MNHGLWIPREIDEDKNLTLTEKHLLAKIEAFAKKGQGCFASNQTLAEKCHCSPRTISRSVQKLIRGGYIVVHDFDGRKRTLHSCREAMAKRVAQDGEAAETQWQQNNISNNTSTNVDDICDAQEQSNQEGALRPASVDEVREYCNQNGYRVDPAEFFDYYEGNGWKTGVNIVQDWHAVLRTWHRRSEQKSKKSSSKANKNTSQSPEPGQPGNSFDTDDFFDAALKRSFGDDYPTK